MNTTPSYKTLAEHQRVVDLIWSQLAHRQKPTSSSWWFFLLFPQEAEGYGRRQLMFSIATRVGRQIRVCGHWQPGLELNRPIQNGLDRFSAMVNGWYGDGQQVHEGFVKGTAVTTLSTTGHSIHSWAARPDDAPVGMSIGRAADHPLALETHVRGQKGSAHFTAWGDLDCLHSSPQISIDAATAVGGVHFIAWRRMNFKGEFDLPSGRETLSGIGYFQRVCLNVPTFPWKWIWAVFPDGSLFSAYVPYVGLNLLRRGYRFFKNNRKEQTAVSLFPSAFWDWAGPSAEIRFNQARIMPILSPHSGHPYFDVQVGNKQGDYISFQAVPHGHANLDIDRPVLGGWLRTHWNYNEYMFRIEGLNCVWGQTHHL
ncbi:MAG: hypothetical protein IPM39_02775 [Chloroflexi bacterium]|nr:hypothetical protein [Chloroflexota bacterium]